MVIWPPGFCRIDTFETEFAERQFIDEDINHSDRIGFRNVLVEQLWQ